MTQDLSGVVLGVATIVAIALLSYFGVESRAVWALVGVTSITLYLGVWSARFRGVDIP